MLKPASEGKSRGTVISSNLECVCDLRLISKGQAGAPPKLKQFGNSTCYSKDMSVVS